jgi:hypothetical protein
MSEVFNYENYLIFELNTLLSFYNRFNYVAQAQLGLIFYLCQYPKCWGCRYKPHPAINS